MAVQCLLLDVESSCRRAVTSFSSRSRLCRAVVFIAQCCHRRAVFKSFVFVAQSSAISVAQSRPPRRLRRSLRRPRRCRAVVIIASSRRRVTVGVKPKRRRAVAPSLQCPAFIIVAPSYCRTVKSSCRRVVRVSPSCCRCIRVAPSRWSAGAPLDPPSGPNRLDADLHVIV